MITWYRFTPDDKLCTQQADENDCMALGWFPTLNEAVIDRREELQHKIAAASAALLTEQKRLDVFNVRYACATGTGWFSSLMPPDEVEGPKNTA